jgi:hypothetical protein
MSTASSTNGGKRISTWKTEASVGYIKVDVKQIGWIGTAWINLCQDKDKAILNTVMNFQVL